MGLGRRSHPRCPACHWLVFLTIDMAEEVLRLLQKEIAGLREDVLRHQEEALSQVRKKLRKHMLRWPGKKTQYIFAERIVEHIDSAMRSLDKEDRVEARALPMEKQRMD